MIDTFPTQLKTFRDAVNPQNMTIDDTYDGVFAYATGRYMWSGEQVRRFVTAGKHLYRYDTVGASPHWASLLDVERYDATPETAAIWVPQRNNMMGDAGVYCNRSTVPAVVDAIGDRETCWLIVADWTGTPHMPALDLPDNFRVAGVQYQNTPGWDLTAIYSADWLAGRHI
jgi:hypothetical protein